MDKLYCKGLDEPHSATSLLCNQQMGESHLYIHNPSLTATYLLKLKQYMYWCLCKHGYKKWHLDFLYWIHSQTLAFADCELLPILDNLDTFGMGSTIFETIQSVEDSLPDGPACLLAGHSRRISALKKQL